MSGFAEALRRSDNLRPLADAIGSYFKQKADQERQKKLLDSLKSLKDDVSGYYDPTTNLESSLQPNPLADKLMEAVGKLRAGNSQLGNAPVNNAEDPTKMGLGNKLKSSLGKGMEMNIPDIEEHPVFQQKITQTETPANYNEANKKAVERENQFVTEGIANNIDEKDINKGVSYAERLRQANQPVKAEYVETDPTKEVSRIDPITGERTVVKSGQPKAVTPKFSSPIEIAADKDYPEKGIKKGDTIKVRYDENDPNSPPEIIGKSKETDSNAVAWARLQWDKEKEANKNNPQAVMESAQATIDEIDKQLVDIPQFMPIYAQLQMARIKQTALKNLAEKKLVGKGGNKKNTKETDPLGIR